MKTLFASTCTALLALSLMTPAHAEGYSGNHALYQDVIIPLNAAEEALDLTKPGKLNGRAMLLPAIQKIREAAARTAATCIDPASDVLDMDCGSRTLTSIINHSESGPEGSPSLEDLVEQGGLSRRERLRLGDGGMPVLDRLLAAMLIGLLEDLKHEGITDDSVLDPINAAIVGVEGLDPDSKILKGGGPRPWHIVVLKK